VVNRTFCAAQLTFQHRDLVPQHQDLGVLVAIARKKTKHRESAPRH
jgi:hypothetical protein